MNEGLRRWGIPSFLLLLVVILSGSAGIVEGTSSSKFCGICHIMRPQETTWQVSAHNKVACTICHVEPGIKNVLRHQLEILRRTYLVLTKSYLLPVEIQHPVSNEVCLSCHTFARTVTPLNDIVIPHAKHIEAGVNCTNCHQGVAHGRIAERNITIADNFEQWTPQFATAQMDPGNLRISMNGCISCHKKRGNNTPT
ncbi:MAG: cytochrome c3 family protein, partial [Paludibacteraceae bacterium]